MALLERRVLIIGLAVYLLLAIFVWFALYQPRLKARQRNAAQAAQLQKQLDDTRERVKGIGALREQVAGRESRGLSRRAETCVGRASSAAS